MRSLLEEEIISHSPSAYYTLAEADGSTSAGDTSGNQAASLPIAGSGTAMTFGSGVGPGADGLTAATFANGQYLGDAALSAGTPETTFAMGCWFNTSTMPATTAWLVHDSGSGISISGPGGTLAGTGTSGSLFGATNVVDGLTHFVALTCDGSAMSLWLDGVQIASTATSAVAGPVWTAVGGTPGGAGGLVGTISHATFWPTLAGADVLAIYQAGTAESGTARITRLAGYAGIPVGTLDASLTNVSAQATSGKSAWEAIQEVADAEFGLVFIDGGGSLVFHNRNRVPSKTAPDLILDRQWVTPDVAPVVDDQQLINYSEVTADGTGSTQLVQSTTSQATHGRYADSRGYLVQTDAEALDRANWIVANFAEPTPRYGTLTINLYGMTQSQAASVVQALDMSSWLRVTSLASQNPGGTTADVVIQGWNAAVTGESWTITCNVVARSLYAAFILDDPVYGVLDSTSKLYF